MCVFYATIQTWDKTSGAVAISNELLDRYLPNIVDGNIIDDSFIDALVAMIVPCEGRIIKFYLNIGSGKGWSLFSESAYELYDYWTLGFEEARRFRKARNQYLRQNQWDDLHIEVYIRTK